MPLVELCIVANGLFGNSGLYIWRNFPAEQDVSERQEVEGALETFTRLNGRKIFGNGFKELGGKNGHVYRI